MAQEGEFDTEALNEGLNTPSGDTPPSYQEEPEEPQEETTQEEPEEEQHEEPQEEATEEEVKPLSRGQQRIQALANEKRLAEERAKLFEQQLEYERQQRAPQKQQEEENLTELEKWQRQADATIRQVQFNNLDMQDRSDFLMSVSKNPAEAAYIERVEQRLNEARRQGFNPKREDVLLRLMGEDSRKKLQAAPAVKRQAAERVKAATGKPLANKANVAPTKAESTEFDRLKDIIL